MTQEEIIDLMRLTLFVAVEVSGPILFSTLLIGLAVSIFQSVTQITETTLIFIPKLTFFVLTFGLTLPWILKILLRFTYDIIVHHWDNIMNLSNTVL